MKNKKAVPIIIIAVLGVIILIFSIIIVCLLINGKNTSDKPEKEEYTDYSPEEWYTSASDENVSFTDESDETGDAVIFLDPSDSEILIAEAIYVVSGTPKGKGTEMRTLASSKSSSKGTLPEGTYVRVLSDNENNETGYVQVLAYIDPMDIHCFVKKEYLKFSEFPYYYETPSENTRYVSYNTPGHAGINMRKEPNSSSECVVTMDEGTPVFIAEPYSSENNGYVKVGCDEYSSGNTIYGWVLSKYLEK